MEVLKKAVLAKKASNIWQMVASSLRDEVLLNMADLLEKCSEEILQANAKDLQKAKENNITGALLDRLTLTKERIVSMADGMRDVANLADPLGEVINGNVRPNGLKIQQVRVPLGVVGMIFEARPNVTADATALCLKAGNVVLLRGGSEAIESNKAIAGLLRNALIEKNQPADVVQIIENTDRAEVQQMLKLNDYIDVIIPRGGAGLIETVIKNSSVPVIETGVGNCHIFVDESANLKEAIDIIDNAKTQRPGVCNAVETILIHENVHHKLLPQLAERLSAKGVKLRGCTKTKAAVDYIELADNSDWETEYLDLILAIKVVNSINEAIVHIAKFGTNHSEAIITESYQNAERFLKEIDAAVVYVNASTRFTDGSQFGMGAEIGISTQKLHARGPMGIKELTTNKYVVYGQGNIRS